MPVEGIAAMYGDPSRNRGDAQGAPRHDWFFALARDLESGDLTAALHDWELMMRSPALRNATETVRELATQLGEALQRGEVDAASRFYGRMEEMTGFHSTAILPSRMAITPARVDLSGANTLDRLLQQSDSPAQLREAAARYLATQSFSPSERQTAATDRPSNEDRFRLASQAYAPLNEGERRVEHEFREEEIDNLPAPDATRFQYHPAFIPDLIDGDARRREPQLRRRASIFWLILFNLAALIVSSAIVGAQLQGGWLLVMIAGVLFFDWLLWSALRPTAAR